VILTLTGTEIKPNQLTGTETAQKEKNWNKKISGTE